MKSKALIAKKIERAKRIVSRSINIKPPLWAWLWSRRELPS